LQAAGLIKNENIGGGTIAATYDSFKKNKMTLARRQGVERSSIVHSLDTLWNMTFVHLTKNAHDLLSVLALLSPGKLKIPTIIPSAQIRI
jgi:hypothetical protein